MSSSGVLNLSMMSSFMVVSLTSSARLISSLAMLWKICWFICVMDAVHFGFPLVLSFAILINFSPEIVFQDSVGSNLFAS